MGKKVERPSKRPLDPTYHDSNPNNSDENNENEMHQNNKKSKKSSGGFQSLGLSEPVYRGVVKMGFRVPTPVQRKALPICLSGVDTVVMARTGSGKTAAFVLPILEKLVSRKNSNMMGTTSTDVSGNSIRAVILSPTRELALQTLKVFKILGTYCENITATGIIGADSIDKQFAALAANPDVLVATPGRLAHLLIEIPDFHLKSCETLVLDEADRLFEMGFSHQIRDICRTIPKDQNSQLCQKMLFSATMPKGLVEFTRESSGVGLTDPVVVRLDNEVQVSDELRIGFFTCRTDDKDAVLLYLVRDILLARKKEKDSTDDNTDGDEINDKNKQNKKKKRKEAKEKKKHENLTLIFCATRHHVEYITTLLKSIDIPATMIYGTMDLEARKKSLHDFRSGHCPVLVVTDVAARGIDIPLIENVIHHSFPPSAKLFIHRSGRAARAGRIGYCFGLVDPEEVPYMVDLHVFLGYKLSTGRIEKDDETSTDKNESGSTQVKKNTLESYSLDEMTPDMVHYGSIPEWILTEQVEELQRLIQNGDNTVGMKKTCMNAMKQYRRSRPDASKAGVRTAKTILEQNRAQDHHPLMKKIEEERLLKEGSDKANDLQKRQEFLKAMANFRPKETIFEAFASGTGSSGTLSSQVDKGQSVGKDNAAFNSKTLKVMKSMRRQMRFVKDKTTSMVVAGSMSAKTLNGDELATESDQNNSESRDESAVSAMPKSMDPPNMKPIISKQRMSKAQRKKMKQNKDNTITNPDQKLTNNTSKREKNVDYRDHEHYIDTTQNYSERQAKMESAMQPSASAAAKDPKTQALRMEEAMLDIVGDENTDLVMKQRMMRWDKSKRKYIQTSLGEELRGGPGSAKKVRTESGQYIKTDKAKIGELYEKWQKKTQKSIGRSGVFDEDADMGDSGGEDQVTKMQQRVSQQNKKLNGKQRDGLKSSNQIRKEREASQKMKIKNMEKGERKRYEAQKNAAHEAKKNRKGYQGKKGFSGKWGKKKK